jgi:predicted Rossmann fold flavoprotein
MQKDPEADVVVVGAGAAGLMAAIQAARARPGLRVVALDGAARPGAKILISGGGRCNVTHRAVSADDFNGSTRPAIARILRRFTVDDTRRFFADEGVLLHEEPTGKLFPVTNRAATVVDALLDAARRAGVQLVHPCRVEAVARQPGHFALSTTRGPVRAARVILATGGLSVPKTGSDGRGYEIAASLGVPLTPRRLPALVPLTLPDGHWVRALSGVTTPVRLTVRSGTGRHLAQSTGSLLCTHQGVSGPAVLDISRHWLDAREDDPDAALGVDWCPGRPAAETDRCLLSLGARTCRHALSPPLPERLAEALVAAAGVVPTATGATLTRDCRRRLVREVHDGVLPVNGTRGFAVAEVTAGGVPLSALRLDTLEARACPGLHICGELCDVDGRLGGFNFQWAWASGTVAGRGAAAGCGGATPESMAG